jgi:hypothetical protein
MTVNSDRASSDGRSGLGSEADVLEQDGERIAPVERRASGKALEAHDAQTIDVAPAVHVGGPRLLGAHVVRRTHRHARAGELGVASAAGDAEIGDHAAAGVIEEHVVRLDVAVHDALAVRIAQRARRLGKNPAGLGGGQRPVLEQPVGQRLAAQELHCKICDLASLADAVDRDDVRMLEPRRDPRFAHEPLDERVVEGERERQHLDRHLAVEHELARPVDDGHAAAAELLEHLVFADQRRLDDVEIRRSAGGSRGADHGARERGESVTATRTGA